MVDMAIFINPADFAVAFITRGEADNYSSPLRKLVKFYSLYFLHWCIKTRIIVMGRI